MNQLENNGLGHSPVSVQDSPASTRDALRRSEQRYRTLFNSIDEGFYLAEIVYDKSGNPADVYYVDENPAAINIVGASLKGALMSSLSPNFEQYWRDTFAYTARTGDAKRLEGFAAPNDIWFDYFVFKPEGVTDDKTFAVLFSDVSERKRREAALRFLADLSESFASYHTAAEIIAGVGKKLTQHLQLDSFKYLTIDEQAGEATVKYIWNNAEVPSCPETFPLTDFLNEYVIDALRSGETYVFSDVLADERINAHSTTLLDIGSGILVPYHHDGKWEGYFSVTDRKARKWSKADTELIREVTNRTFPRLDRARAEEALRISEERYRIVLQSARMAAWDWNIATDEVIWNNEHYTMLGLEPSPKPVSSAYFFQFLYSEDAARVSAELEHAVKVSGSFNSEFRIVRKDGLIRWMSGSGSVVARVEHVPVRVVGVMYDITDQKLLDQHKEDFLGIASHELKTPVTTIKVYTEVLLDTFHAAGNQESVKLMDKLDQQVDRLTLLIRDLLDTTSISGGQLPLNKETVRIDELITDTVKLMQGLTQSHRLLTRLASGSDVFADRERISQVLVNMIDNAIKYSPHNSEVIISSELTDGHVTIQVRDFGIGMSREVQDHVFERFYRSPHPQFATYPGLGLGMFIASEIILKHGGKIQAHGKEGEGSTFSFTLPVDQPFGSQPVSLTGEYVR